MKDRWFKIEWELCVECRVESVLLRFFLVLGFFIVLVRRFIILRGFSSFFVVVFGVARVVEGVEVL